MSDFHLDCEYCGKPILPDATVFWDGSAAFHVSCRNERYVRYVQVIKNGAVIATHVEPANGRPD